MPEDDDDDHFYYDENDEKQWYNNCRPDIGNAIPEEKRRRAAEFLGPNWANIMSGLGDQ